MLQQPQNAEFFPSGNLANLGNMTNGVHMIFQAPVMGIITLCHINDVPVAVDTVNTPNTCQPNLNQYRNPPILSILKQ